MGNTVEKILRRWKFAGRSRADLEDPEREITRTLRKVLCAGSISLALGPMAGGTFPRVKFLPVGESLRIGRDILRYGMFGERELDQSSENQSQASEKK